MLVCRQVLLPCSSIFIVVRPCCGAPGTAAGRYSLVLGFTLYLGKIGGCDLFLLLGAFRIAEDFSGVGARFLSCGHLTALSSNASHTRAGGR